MQNTLPLLSIKVTNQTSPIEELVLFKDLQFLASFRQALHVDSDCEPLVEGFSG